jgi:hypothetical protein
MSFNDNNDYSNLFNNSNEKEIKHENSKNDFIEENSNRLNNLKENVQCVNNLKRKTKQEIKKLVDGLNEGSILYQDLPEEFHNAKVKIRIPVRPIELELEECCGTGCRPCVFDKYEMKIEQYEEDIDNLIEVIYKDNLQ